MNALAAGTAVISATFLNPDTTSTPSNEITLSVTHIDIESIAVTPKR